MATQDTATPAEEPKERKFDRKRLLIVAAVVVVGVAALLWANRPEEPVATEREVEYFRIEFPDHRFSLELPGDWEVFEPEQADPQLVLVAGVSGTQNNLRIRVTPLPVPVSITDTTPDNEIAEFQAQFDQYIDQSEDVSEVIRRLRIKVDGVHGWSYLYTFNDPRSGQEGIHSHIFLLNENRMYVLVFQALPASAYGEMAGVFDKILTSMEFMNDSEVASPAPSPSAE